MKYITTYKSLFAWLMLVVYFLCPLRVYQPYISYSINYDYISTVLCINKEKPKMECNGKCHLNKEIKKTAEEESKKQIAIQNFSLEDVPSEEVYYTNPLFYLLTETTLSPYTETNYSSSLNHITPPPKS